ncbi:hypothetical protein MHC_02210 [Mycoplasma haemocanis str. Illinois]|uniref:Uncharacterized protein n=1 Tax=Mycoplasma haemocanis (strain Illinois) TaxID=1111676 RepID=H6N6N6_MYCHN|nr:hypothetical protein [Mycoplasma haemocanis]AEW45308.1 hypothetical protein MHC_02210 [Mycoplasma haemocanis str. Illinois]
MVIKSSIKRCLFGAAGVSTVAAGSSYYFLNAKSHSEKIDRSTALSRIKNSGKSDWSRTVSEIQKIPEDQLPEGLRAAKSVSQNAQNWAKLFCDEAEYDMNDSNMQDYLNYCT